MTTKKKWIVRIVLLLIALGAVYGWNSLSARPWERGFEQISEGDHVTKLTNVLGQPTEIKDCLPVRYHSDPELGRKCAKEYWYTAFMQEWVYVIDRDGIVVAKWHSVSP